MKKGLPFIPVFFIVFSGYFALDVYAQGLRVEGQAAPNTPNAGAAAQYPVLQMDNTVKELAENINGRLVAEKAEKIVMGQFTYRGSASRLGSYWVNHLSGELANMPNKTYILLSGGPAGADWTISGEIVEVAGIIRVYTRLIRLRDRAVEASFQSDFERGTALNTMLSGSAGGDGNDIDEWEPDSWDNPVPYEISIDENTPVMSRSIHPAGDEDFFLLVPDRDGRLVMETTGRTDTYMEFYEAESRTLLAEDDDSGSGSNARIRYTVQAGHRYIAKVRGYSGTTTGNYDFRAFMPIPREGSCSWENPISCEIGVDDRVPVISRTLDRDDEDYFLLVPADDGRLIMETTGRVDTYMEFYDADSRALLVEDDDGGSGYNARIRYNVQKGKRYIARVRGFDGNDTGDYGFRAYLQTQAQLVTDEYEPDDDPSSASQIEIGTPQQHTFHHADDVDWVKFQITRPGRYTIRVRGVNSNQLDTYIELFDANLHSIAEDDDGGENLDSRLSLHLENGLYYLKIWCLDEEPDQPYTVIIEAN